MNLARNLVVAVLMTIVTTLLLGIAYPLAVTAIAQVVFPEQANGQMLERDGTVVGSSLIGQRFASAGYFRSRPSAAGTPSSRPVNTFFVSREPASACSRVRMGTKSARPQDSSSRNSRAAASAGSSPRAIPPPGSAQTGGP